MFSYFPSDCSVSSLYFCVAQSQLSSMSTSYGNWGSKNLNWWHHVALTFLARSCFLFLISAGAVLSALSATCYTDPHCIISQIYCTGCSKQRSPACEVFVIAFILQSVPKSILGWCYSDLQHLDFEYYLTKLVWVKSPSMHSIIGLGRAFTFQSTLQIYCDSFLFRFFLLFLFIYLKKKK